MKIREYKSADCLETMRLFFDTVHTVNRADYTQEQLDAWAPEDRQVERPAGVPPRRVKLTNYVMEKDN